MSLLRELSGHPEWVRKLNAAKELRPTLPAWDSHNDNTNEWKEKSAMQQGFDLAMSLFTTKE